MQEIELKFQVPADARAAVAAEVAGPGRPNRVRLQAAYFDTADTRLAAAGLALRVRREGRRWVQTLKGVGLDGMTRAEHNVPLTVAAGLTPQADAARHAGTPVGERLLAVLAEGAAGEHAAAPLVCQYGTDIWRRTRRLATSAGDVELAFDEGVIVAGERRLAVCELEIELLSGSAQAVLDVAADWVPRHGLWLDTRTKAERGGMLQRGEAQARARRAQPVALDADATVPQALRAVLLSCLDQINVNASQVASGDFAPEHVHQLRVGLRRLRTALRLFAKDNASAADAAPALGGPAAALFRQLGAARDADAVAAPLAQALGEALRSVGLDPALPAAATPATPDPAACVRAAATQALLLGLLAWLLALAPEAAAPGPRWRPRAAAVLARWHRAVARDAASFTKLEDEARHELRKRAKRLRYAVEFAAPVFAKKAVKAYLKPLRSLQETLGELNDTAVGIAAFRPLADADARALFALGWLASRRSALLREAEPAMQAFLGVKRFWKK